MKQLEDCGLYKDCSEICVGIAGSSATEGWFSNYPKAKIIYKNPDPTVYESLTLQALHQRSKDLSNDHLILYFHTKGAHSQFTNNAKAVSTWRMVMGYWLITKYKRCLSLIEKHNLDVLGGNFVDQVPNEGLRNLLCQGRSHASHYSGNFWWARASYIRRLHCPEVHTSKQNPNTHHHLRLLCENWLLSLFPHVRAGECFRYSDPHPYSSPWNLHDCNGEFVLLSPNKDENIGSH